MGKHMCVDGEWHTDIDARSGGDAFEPTRFDSRINANSDTEFPAETGRYHLYVSYACPWAHGTLLVRQLTGLKAVISVSVLDPSRAEDGWQFSPDRDGCTGDPVGGAEYLREIYTAADPDYTGQVTVPVLWDTERGTIVNNESADIMKMLADAFCPVGNGVDLYPPEHRAAIDEVIYRLYAPVNKGVYRVGFAESQAAYDAAVDRLFDALDHWNDALSTKRYLVADRLTLADLRLFSTLLRFDEVYHTHFKCDKRYVHQYDHLGPFVRDIYQLPGVEETVLLSHIRDHYYRSHTELNPRRIIAAGPDIDYSAPTDRAGLPGRPPTVLTA